MYAPICFVEAKGPGQLMVDETRGNADMSVM